ncbi:hypothetical protein HJFPF1_05785 [Paramyrothecium foliicola]|nr:hypothetical protein HJFPF1_05785 [Paramyrothecium foliicola]
MVSFKVLFTAALPLFAAEGVMANYIVGVQENWSCPVGSPGGCNRNWKIAGIDMGHGGLLGTAKSTGIGLSDRDVCNAWIGDAQVWCYGDVTRTCSDYGVALFKSRKCRTYCRDKGDESPLARNWIKNFFPKAGSAQGVTLVCDRPLD